MVAETNVDRAGQSLAELTVNPLLEEAARQKAHDMAEKGYFSHVGPEGEQPWVWLKGVGYYYLSAGENLAINFTDSKDVTDAWMNSPAHRANMLSGNFTEIGIGTAEGVYKGKETTFVVQFFGKPYTAPEVAAVTREEKKTVAALPKPVVAETPEKGEKKQEKKIVPVLPVATSTIPPEMLVPQPPAPVRPLFTETATIPSTTSVAVLGSDTNVIQGDVVKAKPHILGFVMTNPRQTTLFGVLFFAILVAIGLILTLVFQKNREHRDLVLNGLMFLAVILCLILVNDYLVAKDILIS
jgi:hypothetical protein